MDILGAIGAAGHGLAVLSIAFSLGTSGGPDLVIAKTHNDTPNVGSHAVYLIRIADIGEAPTWGTITVTDTLPAGLVFFDGVGQEGWTVTANGSIVTATFVGSLQPHSETSGFLIETEVGREAYPEVVNWATVRGGGDVDTTNNRVGDTMPVLGSADVTISKTHNGNFTANSTGMFVISVHNNGPESTIDTITVRDTLPAGLTFVSASGSGWAIGHTGQIVTATYAASISAGSTSAFGITVAVSQDAPPSVTNSASVEAWADIDSTNNRSTDVVTVVQPTPAFALDKRHAEDFVAGQNGVFAFTVMNQGLAPTTGAYTVTDTLEPPLTFVVGSGSGWSFAANGQIVTATSAAPLAVVDTSSFTMTVAVSPTAPSVVENSASVRGGGAPGSGYDEDYVLISPGTTDVDGSTPREISLESPLPDPIGAQGARFRYALPRDLRASLAIYDPAGRRVRTLVEGPLTAGGHSVHWDGRDEAGRRVGPGIYFARLQAGGTLRTRRFAVLY